MASSDTPDTKAQKKRVGRKRRPPVAPGPAFQFVVASHPNDFRENETMRNIRSHVMYRHREECQQRRSQSPSERETVQGSSAQPFPGTRTPSPFTTRSEGFPEDSNVLASTSEYGSTVYGHLYNLPSQSPATDPVRNLAARIITAITAGPAQSAPPAFNQALEYPFPSGHTVHRETLEDLKGLFIDACEVCRDQTWMAEVCHSRVSFLSAVSANCVYLDAVEGLLGDSPLTARARAKILQLIQERIQDTRTATDNVTILSILHLLIVEIGGSAEDAFDVHHQGLSRIVIQRGGLGNLGLEGHVATLLAVVMLSFAIVRGQGEPPMTHGFYPSGPNLYGLMTRPPPISPLFAPHGDLSQIYGSCALPTYELLCDMHELTRLLLLRVSYRETYSQPTAEVSSYDAHMQQIYTRLLLRPSTEDSIAPDWIYESCRLAALIYCRSIIQRVPFSDSGSILHARSTGLAPPGTTIITALHNSLANTDRSGNWGDLYGVFLWACLVGGAASWPACVQPLYSGHQDDQMGMAYRRKCFALWGSKARLLVASNRRLLLWKRRGRCSRCRAALAFMESWLLRRSTESVTLLRLLMLDGLGSVYFIHGIFYAIRTLYYFGSTISHFEL